MKLSYVALSLYFFVALLFIFKYGLRVAPPVVVCLAGACYVVFILFLLLRLWPRFSGRIRVSWLMCGFGLALAVLMFGQMLIDPYSLQVDRWSAIHNHLSYLFQGIYPYAAQTHLGGYGSPFPVWQMLHVPFFLLGNVGWSFVAGVVLFLWMLYRVTGVGTTFLGGLLLLVHPAFLYEVAVRSDLFTNFLISASVVLLFWHRREEFGRLWWCIALVAGLLLSTRFTAVVPLAVLFFVPFLKRFWWQGVASVVLALIVFAATFVPLLLWDSDTLLFFEFNPFVLQTRQSHISDLLLAALVFVSVSFLWGGGVKNGEYLRHRLDRYAIATATCLLLLVGITFLHNMWLYDSWDSLFSSMFDITYFDMSLPFLIICISVNSFTSQ